jgi:transposase
VLADGGYSGETFAQAVQEKLGCGVEIAKRSELHTFAVIPKRWVVERSFAWLENAVGCGKNCERKTQQFPTYGHTCFTGDYSKIVNGFL